MVYVFLAQGFEEIEALAPVDILRRAGLTVCTVGIGGKTVVGSHGIAVQADLSEEESRKHTPKAVILPGGLPGADNLNASDTVQQALDLAAKEGAVIGAICAAPYILGQKGLLNGKKAVCYPGYEDQLIGASVQPDAAVIDGTVVTGKGAGAAVDFALALVSVLVSSEKAAQLREALQCP